MSPSILRHAGVLCLTAFSVVACAKSEQQKQADAASKQIEAGAKAVEQGAKQIAQGAAAASQQMTQGLQQMAQGAQQMAQNSTKAVDFEELKAVIPDLDGWAKSDVRGEEMTMPVSYSRAQARYRKNEGRIELEITDTALSQLLLAPLSVFLTSGYAERSDNGFKRAVKVANQPGMEDWNAKSSRGEVTAVVANRFVVKAIGHQVETIEPVRMVVEAVDFPRLAALR